MKGHIRKRSKNSWSLVIELERDANGKRRQKWYTVRGTKRDAERELHRLLTSVYESTYVEPNKLTVAQFLEQWLEGYAKGNVSRETFYRYRGIVRRDLIPALGRLPLSKLQALHIQTYYSNALEAGRKDGKGGLSKKTILQIHRILREALHHAVRWKLLARNPADVVDAPRPQRKEMRALDEKETMQLLNTAQGRRFYYPIMVAVTTGMRRGEILGLRWKDVNLDARSLSVRQCLEQVDGRFAFKPPKTAKSRRSIALSPITVEALRAHKREQAKERLLLGHAYQNHDLVFPRPDGEPWSPDALTHGLSDIVQGTELEGITFHSLRHSHATQLLRQGVHPKIVSERLGHSTVSITLDIYSHVLPGMQEDAALKVDAALRAAVRDNK